MDSFRKAYGALKDSTKVGLAKVNSDFKDLDIAIVKATNHVECPPKERHVRNIFAAVSLASPRADVGYCIHALTKRLSKTRSWIVAIKSLIVFHRILREGDSSFREELMHISRRGHIFQISHFKDDSSALAWDCSSWIRSYAMFLEERLECFRNLKLDLDSSERGGTNRSSSTETKEKSKDRVSDVEQLLEQLPVLQQLLYRLVCCQPEGAARYNFLVQYALALVVKESFRVYCTINDGIIVLVDKYFDMPQQLAVAALSIYKKAGRQADHLADFYDFCKTLDLARTFQFPILRQPPSSFLVTMEEYVKEAPEKVSPSHRMQRRKDEAQKSEENGKQVGNKAMVAAQQKPAVVVSEADLLGLNEPSPRATQSEESNSLALAICQTGNEQAETNHANTSGSGWELALVTTPSTTNSPQTKHDQAGGFDKMLLDRLYEDDISRRQLQLQRAGYGPDRYGYGCGYGASPFEQPFSIASSPADARMMMMSPQQRYQMMMMQQQQQQQQQQHNMMMMMMMASHNQNHPYASPYHQQQQQQQQQIVSMNPFGDPFSYPQSSMPPHPNRTLF
ncbi:putative clathrin assembly protein At4g25940 isoform X2 [Salvia miltiorrhiza]|uniref:putative clathrin assembly protein At4g25940 isoform X2 n=1 Tax=Salvia miltiorrhiza TaxID=226208 RepID=UPI0025AC09BE|nr:putative clathrin assembly protein At4g25940 isoform X2 [Salvia miltiorrhiza]